MNSGDDTPPLPAGPLPAGDGGPRQPEPAGLPAELRARQRSRRTWIIASIAVVAVMLAAVIAIIVSATGGPSAAGQFDKAYSSFHAQFGKQSAALNAHLQQAGNGELISLSDPNFIAATNDAKALANLYHNYAKSVEAIPMPSSAKAGTARPIRVAAAGQFLMSQAADSVTKSGMQELLDPLRQQVTTELTKAENTVRKALGLTT